MIQVEKVQAVQLDAACCTRSFAEKGFSDPFLVMPYSENIKCHED